MGKNKKKKSSVNRFTAVKKLIIKRVLIRTSSKCALSKHQLSPQKLIKLHWKDLWMYDPAQHLLTVASTAIILTKEKASCSIIGRCGACGFQRTFPVKRGRGQRKASANQVQRRLFNHVLRKHLRAFKCIYCEVEVAKLKDLKEHYGQHLIKQEGREVTGREIVALCFICGGDHDRDSKRCSLEGVSDYLKLSQGRFVRNALVEMGLMDLDGEQILEGNENEEIDVLVPLCQDCEIINTGLEQVLTRNEPLENLNGILEGLARFVKLLDGAGGEDTGKLDYTSRIKALLQAELLRRCKFKLYFNFIKDEQEFN